MSNLCDGTGRVECDICDGVDDISFCSVCDSSGFVSCEGCDACDRASHPALEEELGGEG
jgi:hypothetical protein